MKFVTPATQEEFEKAAAGDKLIRLKAGTFVLSFVATVPLIELEGSARLEIIVKQESSSVVARGSSSVVARGDVFVRYYSGDISASESVVIKDHSMGRLSGMKAIVSAAFIIDGAEKWCIYHGVKIEDGLALLFKGVSSDFKSKRGGDYTPGTTPVCHDWDGGVIECGGGYHVSPTPRHTHEFCTPKKYVAGWVNLSDIAVHPNGMYPWKVKIHKYEKPVWECDINGEPVK